MVRGLHSLSLRYFVEVANAGSINMASESLHVAASAISRQLAKFEDELGMPLFERRPRGMALTEAGQLLLDHARRSLLEDEQLLNDLGAMAASRGGSVNVASSQGFATDFLPRLIAAFQRERPGVGARLFVTSPADATDLVRRGEMDVAVTFSLAPDPGVHVEYAAVAPVYALVPRGHALAGRADVSLRELCAHPLILSDVGTTIRQLIDMACALEGITLSPVFVSNNSAALYRHARQSGAVMFSGYVTVSDSLARDGFVALPIRGNLYPRRLEVQTMAGRRLPAATRALVDAIAAGMELARASEPLLIDPGKDTMTLVEPTPSTSRRAAAMPGEARR